MSKINAIRNSEGIWINSNMFSDAAKHFKKYGYYTENAWGSSSWYDFWQQERERSLYGYSVGGAKITGDHYFYLNYCPIQKSSNTGEKGYKKGVSSKIKDFADFWDGDYNYFWIREIARNGVLLNADLKETQKEAIYQLPPLERSKKLLELYNKIHLYHSIVPHQKDGDIFIDNLLGGKDVSVLKARRKGFEQPKSEIVMTPKGETTMGELKVGDTVLTPTGKANVLEVYEQGEKDVYEVTLYDGRKVKCGENHLWKVYDTVLKEEKTVSLKTILKNYKTDEKYRYVIYNTKLVEYERKNGTLNPYTLGVLSFFNISQKIFRIFIKDFNIVSFITEDLEKNNFKVIRQYENNICVINNSDINLVKLIDKYAIGDSNQRLTYLKGVFDAFGVLNKDNTVVLSHKNAEQLSFVQKILCSLSMTANLKTINDKNYLHVKPDKVLFKFKKHNTPLKRKYTGSAIVKIEKLGYKEDSACILIDSKEHLYLTKSYIVTHNSYKNSSHGVNNFFHRPQSYTMYMAYEKKYLHPKGIYSMATNYINFINEHTGWAAPSDYIRREGHIRNSYKSYEKGVEVEKGAMSEIQAISFKDNPQAGIGKDCYDVIGEEIGTWGVPGGLKETVASMSPSTFDGDNKTGLMTLFGTANDMEKGTLDFAEIYENPLLFNMLPFYDVWGKNPDKIESFFFPMQLNFVGHYDTNGNSDFKSAVNYEEGVRKQKELSGATKSVLMQRMREFPMNSAEALSSVSYNTFPVAELKARLEIVKNLKLQQKKGTPVEFVHIDGELTTNTLQWKDVSPITSYTAIPEDTRGVFIMYEDAIPNAPKGLYKIGYDPVRQDQGTSLASIIVYKSAYVGARSRNKIVGEYLGRLETSEDIDVLSEKITEYYNTTIMHENEVTSVKNYYRRKKKLHLLATQPDLVISKNVKNSTVARVYGCHMNGQLKEAGERYTKDWLLEIIDYDEFGNPVKNLDEICSIRFLEELINYNRKGNFDYISAFIMCMIQKQEESLEKEYNNEKTDKKVDKLLKMYKIK